MFYSVRNDKVISTLLPALQPKARTLAVSLEAAGIWFLWTEGRRTWLRQAWLYASGRLRPGPILTKAKPGTGKHETGRALDFVPADGNGVLHWQDTARINQIGAIAKSQGWTWGGDFPGFRDIVHIEYNGIL